MKSPFTGKEMIIVYERRTMSFRKEEFKVLFHSYKCEDTGEKFEDDILSQLNFNQLENQYRVKYNIPFTEQIISIRKKYNLSASKMSEILGLGTNIYRQYEGGEVPSQSNARLIQLADDPHEFRKLAKLCSNLDPDFMEKLEKRVENLLEEQKRLKAEKQLERYLFGASLPNNMTGFKIPDIQKFTEMVVFFAEKLEPWKTKLNKLLFYTDFIKYKNTGFSMSGAQYRAIPLGPVPNNFNSIYEYLCNKKEIDINYINISESISGEQFVLNKNRAFNKSLFNEAELKILEYVAERFKNTSTNDIIDISHKEKAWIENWEEKKLIDYNYSFELN
ncbi:MAG: type II toxin-antitoxin system antitoxin SocA domain-containing protein [Bacteroidales bacterium]